MRSLLGRQRRWATAGGVLLFVVMLGASVVLIAGGDQYEVTDAPLPALPIRALDGQPVALSGRPWVINIWLPG